MNWFTETVCLPRGAWIGLGITFCFPVSLLMLYRYSKAYSNALTGLVKIAVGMDVVLLTCVRRAVLLSEFNKALARIATVYGWHDKFPAASSEGHATALFDVVQIAKEALGTAEGQNEN